MTKAEPFKRLSFCLSLVFAFHNLLKACIVLFGCRPIMSGSHSVRLYACVPLFAKQAVPALRRCFAIFVELRPFRLKLACEPFSQLTGYSDFTGMRPLFAACRPFRLYRTYDPLFGPFEGYFRFIGHTIRYYQIFINIEVDFKEITDLMSDKHPLRLIFAQITDPMSDTVNWAFPV